MDDERDKGTILNQIVQDAARIMEMKVENEMMVADLLEENGKDDTAANVRNRCNQSTIAIEIMRKWDGCWN